MRCSFWSVHHDLFFICLRKAISLFRCSHINVDNVMHFWISSFVFFFSIKTTNIYWPWSPCPEMALEYLITWPMIGQRSAMRRSWGAQDLTCVTGKRVRKGHCSAFITENKLHISCINIKSCAIFCGDKISSADVARYPKQGNQWPYMWIYYPHQKSFH